MRDLLRQIDALAPPAAGFPGWAGMATDAKAVEDAFERATRLRAAIAAAAHGPERLMDLRRVTSGLVVDANEMLTGDGAACRGSSPFASCAGSHEPGYKPVRCAGRGAIRC